MIPPVPLYLVRWPDLSAALVSAANEDVLVDILDEIANPEGCTWTVYRGPVFIEFNLNATVGIDRKGEDRDRPLEPGELRTGDVSRICQRDVMSAAIPSHSDTAYEMVEALTRTAFPALHKVVDTAGETIPEKKVRDALRQELDLLVQATWRHEQTKRRGDQDSRIAAAMGTSPKLVQRWRSHVAEAEAEERVKEQPSKPPRKPATPRRKRSKS